MGLADYWDMEMGWLLVWSVYISRICDLVIHMKKDTCGLYISAEIRVIGDAGGGLRCPDSYDLYVENDDEVNGRSGLVVSLARCGRNQVWLSLGFSEQFGVLDGVNIYGLIDMEATVMYVLVMSLWHVFIFYQSLWLWVGLHKCQGYAIDMMSSRMFVMIKDGEGVWTKALSTSHGQIQKAYAVSTACYCIMRWFRRTDSRLFTTVLEKGLLQFAENQMIKQSSIVGNTWNMIIDFIYYGCRGFSTVYNQKGDIYGSDFCTGYNYRNEVLEKLK